MARILLYTTKAIYGIVIYRVIIRKSNKYYKENIGLLLQTIIINLLWSIEIHIRVLELVITGILFIFLIYSHKKVFKNDDEDLVK
jgi:hypothetical protein